MQYKTVIIDNSLIGKALYMYVVGSNNESRALLSHNANVDLITELENTSVLSNKINESLSLKENLPFLILINKKIIKDCMAMTGDFDGLDIVEYVRLSGDERKVAIFLYSFEDISSSAVKGRLKKYLNLPGHFYLKMPFRIHGMFERAAEYWSFNSKEIDVRNQMLSCKAQRISKQYIREFKHLIVDKTLPDLKMNVLDIESLKYRAFQKQRILALFSDNMSPFIGCDMKSIFADEYRSIQHCLNDIEKTSIDRAAREIDKLIEILKGVLNKLVDDEGRLCFVGSSYETERQSISFSISKIGAIFKGLWDIDIWNLSNERYVGIVQEMKPHVAEYYVLRLQIENALWRVSISELGKAENRSINKILTQLLDPFIERIENNDYAGALRQFDRCSLEVLKIQRNTTLRDLFFDVEERAI